MIRLKPRSPKLIRNHRLANGLVGAWPFYEGAGGALTDLSAGQNKGTLTGFSSAPLWISSPFGSALTFANSGANDRYVNIPFKSFTGPPLTAVCLAKPATVSSYRCMIGGRTQFKPTLVLSGAVSNPLGYLWEGTADEFDAASGLFLSTTEFNLCAVVITASAATLYVVNSSGLKSFTNTKTHTSNAVNNPLTFANDRDIGGAASHFWDGDIAAGAIYNRALSVAEITQLYFDPFAIYRRSYSRVGVTLVPNVSAPLGWFDPDLRLQGWFDPELSLNAWVDRELGAAPAAVADKVPYNPWPLAAPVLAQ